ncbi:hypothetical protein [Streptomyces sp. 351MFTsu5.1]|uniref:hypothetical protein n=1 Tax=Streptomyces sp. 351MFTsu5.1 TaxID=1172180 RepID=UPI00038280C2|nr:hypothetical protein [Streptomyces sp. 351MFTsu5.1]
MNRAEIYGGINLDLNDGPIRTKHFRDHDGKPCAQLIIGEAGQSVAISVTRTSPDVLDELAEAVAELKAWTLRQQQPQPLKAVV